MDTHVSEVTVVIFDYARARYVSSVDSRVRIYPVVHTEREHVTCSRKVKIFIFRELTRSHLPIMLKINCYFR